MDEKLREAYAELHASVKAMLSWRNGTVKTGLGYIRDTDGSRDQIQLVADALDRIKSLERAQPAAPAGVDTTLVIGAQIAELEARLEEAKWWKGFFHPTSPMCNCDSCRRIALESQIAQVQTKLEKSS